MQSKKQKQPITAISRDSYELHLEIAKRLISDASTSLKDWKRWIPHDQIAHLEGRVKALKEFCNNLEARRAEILTAPRIAEEEEKNKRVSTYVEKRVSSSTTIGSATSCEVRANQST